MPSLNPFEFRAGIYFEIPVLSASGVVLIPLNSGLVFTSFARQRPGLVYGLNPFEFRAGIYLHGST